MNAQLFVVVLHMLDAAQQNAGSEPVLSHDAVHLPPSASQRMKLLTHESMPTQEIEASGAATSTPARQLPRVPQ